MFERMSTGASILISASCFVAGLILFVGVSAGMGMAVLNPWIMMLLGAMVWGATYFVWGFRIVPEMEYRVVERLGQYLYTQKKGWMVMCLPGLIDRIPIDGGTGDYKYKRIKLYEGDMGAKNLIDFTDGSAPIEAEIWYRVNPEDDDSAARWTYVAEDSENRLREVIDATARPKLQRLTIDDAQKNLDTRSDEVRNDPGVVNFLTSVGAQLESNKGFLITDVALPPDIIATRQETLKGQKEAEKQTEQAAGYIKSILKIIQEAKDAGITLTYEQAQRLYETQRGLETLGKTGSNISFVSPEIKGLLNMVGVKTP